MFACCLRVWSLLLLHGSSVQQGADGSSQHGFLTESTVESHMPLCTGPIAGGGTGVQAGWAAQRRRAGNGGGAGSGGEGLCGCYGCMAQAAGNFQGHMVRFGGCARSMRMHACMRVCLTIFAWLVCASARGMCTHVCAWAGACVLLALQCGLRLFKRAVDPRHTTVTTTRHRYTVHVCARCTAH